MMVNNDKRDLSFYVILFLGFIIFLQNAWVPGFFHDGLLYSSFGKNAAEKGHWLIPHLSQLQYPRFDQHPPFLFILEGLFFKIFGSDFLQARLFAGLWGIGILTVFYRSIAAIVHRQFAFIASLFLLLIPFFFKKVRFPNLDIPLTLCLMWGLLIYFRHYQNKFCEKKPFLLIGLLFGLGLLIKGPFALILPFLMALHLLLTKNVKVLLTPRPWLGLILGLSLFALWPLALFLKGDFIIFTNYMEAQVFRTIITGRDTQQAVNYFQYLMDLFKANPVWTLLIIFGIGQKELRSNSFFRFSLLCFLGMLIPLSLMKFKYSNYLIPLMPFFALTAAMTCLRQSAVWAPKILLKLQVFALALALAFIIFPIGSKVRRDPSLNLVSEIIEREKLPVKKVINLASAYPYWSLVSYMQFRLNLEVEQKNEIEMVDGKILIIANEDYYQKTETLQSMRLLLKEKGRVFLIGP